MLKPEWQLPNIQNAGLESRVANVYITQGDEGKAKVLKSLAERHEPIFHIDDRPDELDRLKHIPGVEPILLNRGHIPGATGGYTSLAEVQQVIASRLPV